MIPLDLLWQKRLRGVLPATANSLAPDGRALLVRPDEREPRTYQVLELDIDGAAIERLAVSSETVYKFDGSVQAPVLLAMADDDIYLFHEGRKTRFLMDRRVLYTDASLAFEAGRFFCGFRDELLESSGVALGDLSGRLGWSRELPAGVNRVAAAPDGQLFVAGLHDGSVLAFDAMRGAVWEHLQPEPVGALGLIRSGGCVLGTDAGSVLRLDHEGAARWRAPVGARVEAAAVDECGRSVAVGLEGGRLLCLDGHGDAVWEHGLEWPVTGLSFTADARFLLVTAGGGFALLFELAPRAKSAGVNAPRREREFSEARAAREAGGLRSAHRLLTSLLERAPEDLEAAAMRWEVEGDLRREYLQRAGAEHAAGRYAEELELLNEAFALAPWDTEVYQRRVACREALIAAETGRAAEAEAAGEWENAEAAWRDAVLLAPEQMDAREGLARVRCRRAGLLAAEGDAFAHAGDPERALRAWREALHFAAVPGLEERLRATEAQVCLAAGIAHYEAQRLPEAVFQLRKALALEPDNAEAARCLAYAEGDPGDTTIAERFAHLE